LSNRRQVYTARACHAISLRVHDNSDSRACREDLRARIGKVWGVELAALAQVSVTYVGSIERARTYRRLRLFLSLPMLRALPDRQITHQFLVCCGADEAAWRPNSPQKPTSRRIPRPPAEPARAARDGRRHAACRSLRQNLSFLAASGAPLVRSRVKRLAA
jgi:hypothetical protein